MNRRALLTALPAAVAVRPAPALTPVAMAYIEWQAAERVADNLPADADDAECEAACKRAFDLADEILGMPSQEPKDFVRKLMAYTFYGRHQVNDGQSGHMIWAEARALLGDAA